VRQLGDLVDLPAPEEVDVGAPPEELLECANQLQGAEALASTAATRKVEELQAMATELAAPADAALQELIALKEKADPGGAKIAVSLDATSPLDPETVGSVQQLRGAALAGRAEADGEVQRAEGDRSLVAELDRRIAALTNWSADLAGAVEVLKKDQFPAWARDQRITELVQSSSDLLSQMTGGRYRFDPHLRISDEIAGVVRSASTLSGGEKFEAALALALGVAEIAGRSGIRFDTLFLDEGFAGLDQANLDRALDALETEVEAGRCIVLITHIGAVADRIKDVLLVESDGSGGSKTRWLNEEERFELGADLDLVSIGDA
jgi:exonuclease SbcC